MSIQRMAATFFRILGAVTFLFYGFQAGVAAIWFGSALFLVAELVGIFDVKV